MQGDSALSLLLGKVQRTKYIGKILQPVIGNRSLDLAGWLAALLAQLWVRSFFPAPSASVLLALQTCSENPKISTAGNPTV